MNIAVKGIGVTKFGQLWQEDAQSLARKAAQEALIDAGVSAKKLDAVFVANMLLPKISGQNHLGPFIAQIIGADGVPAFATDSACASGGMATHLAIQAIISGTYETVLVVGVEKMTDVSSEEIATMLMGAGSPQEAQAGLTFPGLYALMAKEHMRQFGTTRKHLAAVSIKNHYHGSLNPLAHFQFEVTTEKVLHSSPVTTPLTLLDCAPISDGASALVLSAKRSERDVSIVASSVATDTLGLSERKNLVEIPGTSKATKKALSQAGVTHKDIDVLEVHDCFSIAEILAMEDIGFCKKGDGGKFVSSGQTKLGGKIPINTSGGLKANGHPVGATGVKQIAEITQQLRGNAGKRQVNNAKVGLTHNVGGTGATVVMHVLKK